ncbi:MAG: hypothetical protein KGD73_02435 [Candidatus Lokiarchaeota archaeon]|nr:hypothetical protein [Candidatus Lokiarchaeota archaeon]
MIESNERDDKSPKKKPLIRITLLILFISTLVVFFFILIHFGTTHLISFLIVLFIFLVGLGPIINYGRKISRSQFSRFKKRNQAKEYKRNKDTFKIKSTPIPDAPNLESRVKLDFTYKKPLIRKCPKCGFMLTSFMKKCPNCGKPI